ncbi:MAG: hypothetical protein K0Q93_104 [Nocardioidaceae bacterium]|jgi:hypothetical protein|nr:hypothetical protein [Nocardioidaceae bacterium]
MKRPPSHRYSRAWTADEVQHDPRRAFVTRYLLFSSPDRSTGETRRTTVARRASSGTPIVATPVVDDPEAGNAVSGNTTQATAAATAVKG